VQQFWRKRAEIVPEGQIHRAFGARRGHPAVGKWGLRGRIMRGLMPGAFELYPFWEQVYNQVMWRESLP